MTGHHLVMLITGYRYMDFTMPGGLRVVVDSTVPEYTKMTVVDTLLKFTIEIEVSLFDPPGEVENVARALARTAMIARMKYAIEAEPLVLGIDHTPITEKPGEGPTA